MSPGEASIERNYRHFPMDDMVRRAENRFPEQVVGVWGWEGQPIEAHNCLQMLNMPVFCICIYKFDIYKPLTPLVPHILLPGPPPLACSSRLSKLLRLARPATNIQEFT